MSEKYKVLLHDKPNFLTLTVVGWVDLFIRPVYTQILDESFRYCMKSKGLIIEKLRPPYTIKYDINIPSRKLFKNKGFLAFPIKSELDKDLLIFKWQSGGLNSSPQDYSWVFSYKIQETSLPVFILKPKKFFLNLKQTAIQVNKSFDEKYLFESPHKYEEGDEKKIKEIFKNTDLQTIILSYYPICIECNGTEIFYYRKNDSSKLESVPEILIGINELHNKVKEIKTVIQ